MDYKNKTTEELIKALQTLELSNTSLDLLYKNTRKDLESSEFLLSERIKELRCHNQLTEILGNRDYLIDEVLTRIVKILPDAWQFQKVAEAMIQVGETIFATEKFELTKWKQQTDIILQGEKIGIVSVGYLENDRVDPNEPFINEENELLLSISGRLSNYIEKDRVKNSLLKSELKYRNLIENIIDVVYEINGEGVINYISPSIEKLIGFTQQDLIGKSFLNFIDKDSGYLAQRFLELSVKGETVNDYEIISKTGKTHWIRFSTKVMFENGRFGGGYGTLVDITERKLAEEEKKKLLRAIEQSPVSIVITNIEGNIEYANTMACETTGYILDELSGQNPRVLKSGETTTEEYNVLWNTITSGNNWHGIFHNKRKNGELYWESSTISPITDVNGKITSYLAIKEDITERKKTEEALLLSEERFSQVTEQSQTVIWKVDNKGLYTYVSPMAEKVWGHKQCDLIGKFHFYDLHPEDGKDEFKEIGLQSFSRKESFHNFINPVITKDGQQIWVSTNGVPFMDDKNNLIGYRGADNNVTERILAEEKIKEQNDRLSAIINALPDKIFITASDGTYLEYYSSIPNQLTIPDNEIVGMNLKDIFDSKTANLHLRKIEECLKDKIGVTYEFSGQQDSITSYIEVRLVPMTNSRVMTFVRDISDKKLKEIQIKRLSQAVEQSPVSIVITDLDSNIEYVNPAFEETTGYSFEEVLGRKTKILKSGKTSDSVYKELWETITQEKEWHGEWINKKKNGELYWENISISPIHDESGKVTNYLAVKLDITPRKQSEQEIRELNENLELKIQQRTEQLAETNLSLVKEIEDRKKAEDEIMKARLESERANMAKSEFLSRMSHELRTPMNSILGFAQLLDLGDLNPGQKKGVKHIMRSGKHLLDLINEVLDISRIEAGHLSLSLEPVQVFGVIHEMMELVSEQAKKRQIKIEFVESENNHLFLKSDKQRLKQIILNLINNAIKYNKPGGIATIEVSLIPQNKSKIPQVRISVKDTGLGIAAEYLPKLFNPFERIGAEKTETEGTGLGLSVVKKLVDAMEGEIGVESEPGIGSTFWVEFPLSEDVTGRIRNKNILEGLDQSLENKSGTILYIEDNSSNIELVREIILSQRSGIRLITEMLGKKALPLAVEYQPSLILLDLNLPDIHGSEVLKILQSNDLTKDIPVVIISADAMPMQIERLMAAGSKRYITKPLDLNILLKIIDEYVI
ncbi:MAG: PAS domain S-box protein [Prolixibacteraceae bacterium]